MKTLHLPNAARALLGGAVCLAILGGMMVGHAWPLWTGQTVLLRARPVDPRHLLRGEYVRLDTPGTRLFPGHDGGARPEGSVPVRVLGDWKPRRGQIVYVQLERHQTSGEHEPVTISDGIVDGAVNLRGRVRRAAADGALHVDYGLDAFYVQEGTAKPVEQAFVEGRLVQMEVAVASSGRARIRTIRIDGVAAE